MVLLALSCESWLVRYVYFEAVKLAYPMIAKAISFNLVSDMLRIGYKNLLEQDTSTDQSEPTEIKIAFPR